MLLVSAMPPPVCTPHAYACYRQSGSLPACHAVRAALHAGRDLTAQERDIHDAGQVSILRTLHDRLDAAVAAAYGWPADLADANILARLVALNAARRAKEEAGLVRWLRPEFQAPKAARHATQRNMEMVRPEKSEPAAWPKSVPEQYVALRTALAGRPIKPGELAKDFAGGPRDREMREMLRALVAMGQAHLTEGGSYVA